MRKLAPFLATAVLAAIALAMIFSQKADQAQNITADKVEDRNEAPSISPRKIALSLLAQKPDWSALEPYQETITRDLFENLLTNIFTTDSTWKSYIEIFPTHANLRRGSMTDPKTYRLNFATSGSQKPTPSTFKTRQSSAAPSSRIPLSGLHIAIDPGHIGGDWAKIEERWFQIGTGTPVTEGDMTLKVASLLRPLLEEMGAKVSMVRTLPEPVTPLRPADLTHLAPPSTDAIPNESSTRRFTEKLFYRTAEIRARADLVNDQIKPDLVLCLHFNAAGWGDPENPTLVPNTHFHILVNGGYTPDEIHLADQRFALVKKILQRIHTEERSIAQSIAKTFSEKTKLPPYIYPPGEANYRKVPNTNYVYARNLLANRLYDCPVIFMEPYVMNSVEDYARIQAGDYQGLRLIAGKNRPSIFQEYAKALAAGLAEYYADGSQQFGIKNDPPD